MHYLLIDYQKEYSTRSPRVINKQWIQPLFKKDGNINKDNEALEFLCSMLKENTIEQAAKETESKYGIPVIVDPINPSRFSRKQKQTRIVRIG